MTETEERLFRMMEQQQALTAALIARLGGVLQGDVPGMVIEAAPEAHRIEAQASVPADDGLPRMRIEDIVPLFTQYYEGMLKRAHIAHYNFHSLRHTFVSRHIRAGINAKAVSAYVGHADLKMTLGVYTHLNEDDMRQVVVNKTEARNGKA